jgi:hypothetical protein
MLYPGIQMLNNPCISIYFRILGIAYVDTTPTANASLFAILLQECTAYWRGATNGLSISRSRLFRRAVSRRGCDACCRVIFYAKQDQLN